MKRDRKLIVSPFKIIKIIRQYDRQYLLWSGLIIFISAVLPLLFVYGPKMILDTLLSDEPFTVTVTVIAVFGVILLVLNMLNNFFSSKQLVASSRFTRRIQYDIGQKIMAMDLYKLENPKIMNTIQLAGNISSITNTVSCVSTMISGIITIIGLSYVIVKLDIVCILSVIAVVALKTFVSRLQLNHQKKVRKKYADNNRVGNYLDGAAYFSPGAAKEVRVNHAESWFMGKVSDFRKTMVALQCRDFAYGAWLDILLMLITAAQTFFVLYFTAIRTVNGELDLAEFTMVFSATLTLTTAFASFGEQINKYRTQVLPVNEYDDLLNYSRSVVEKNVQSHGTPVKSHDIIFDHVSFSYDNGEHFALKNICLTIKEKEKLVIVGLNGSGKSTLIKLLCKFYKPTSGTITLNGVDIWSIDNQEYYTYLAAVFQDYSVFAFPISENVTMREEFPQDDVKRLLEEVGLIKYAHSPDTVISKVFSDKGIELSGGEGQKLAIARAVYKNAGILILDEPTSSLDVKAEAEIYRNFYKMSKDKTTIFVSHRLACSTISDHIAVFSNGKMVEYGSHESLMQRQGLYADMYDKQRSAYVNSV